MLRRVAWVTGCVVLASTFASGAGAFTISNPGGTWTDIAGQSFSPSLEPAPDPGLAPGDTVYLTDFTFISSGGAGALETRLVILPGAWYDTNGDPNGSFTPILADALGVSTNSFDTLNAATGTTFTFLFDNVALTYGDSYTAAFVTIGDAGVLGFHAVGAYTVDYVEISPGTWAPSTNYGGADNWNAAVLLPDTNGDGFFQGFNDAPADANFTATFVVPEPVTLALCGIGLALFSGTRRRISHPR